jgi:hypothetical protein
MVVSAAATTRASSATIAEPIEARPSTQRWPAVVRLSVFPLPLKRSSKCRQSQGQTAADARTRRENSDEFAGSAWSKCQNDPPGKRVSEDGPMSTAVIRYQTRPEAAEENQRLIEEVFAQLAAAAPPGLHYSTFRLADGVTFVHVVDGEGLAELEAFQEFQRAIQDRLAHGREGETAVLRETAVLVGSYSAASTATDR